MMAFRRPGNATLATLGITLVLGTPTVLAQPASAQAEAMFREGRALLDAGKVASACTAFEASQKLESTTSTLLNLAACREKNNQFATAWGLFLDAERQTRTASDEATRKLHQVALDRAKKLESRVSKLTINVSADSRVHRLEILRGGEVVDPAMWSRALPVDGGTYKVTASAPGATAWTTEITIGAESDTKTVEIPKLQNVAAPVLGATRDTPTPQDQAAGQQEPVDAPSDTGLRKSRPRLPLVIAGGGALLIGGAAGFILWGNSTYNSALSEKTSQSHRDSLYSSANTKRHIAFGMGAAGIACGGVAAWLYFTGRPTEQSTPRTTAMRIVPLIGDTAGVAVMGGF